MNDHCARRPKDSFKDHLADLAQRTARGDNSLHAGDAWTLDDFKEDHEVRRKVLKSELRRIAAEAATVAAPIFGKFAEAVDRLADSLEAEAARPGGEVLPSLLAAYAHRCCPQGRRPGSAFRAGGSGARRSARRHGSLDGLGPVIEDL